MILKKSSADPGYLAVTPHVGGGQIVWIAGMKCVFSHGSLAESFSDLDCAHSQSRQKLVVVQRMDRY